MAEEWFYEIDTEQKIVTRYDRYKMSYGFLGFDDVKSLMKNPHNSKRYHPDVFALYCVAYDELIDRGLVKEEE